MRRAAAICSNLGVRGRDRPAGPASLRHERPVKRSRSAIEREYATPQALAEQSRHGFRERVTSAPLGQQREAIGEFCLTDRGGVELRPALPCNPVHDAPGWGCKRRSSSDRTLVSRTITAAAFQRASALLCQHAHERRAASPSHRAAPTQPAASPLETRTPEERAQARGAVVRAPPPRGERKASARRSQGRPCLRPAHAGPLRELRGLRPPSNARCGPRVRAAAP